MIRIFSDVHYGERASRVRRLAQLRPLCDGPEALILNGDTLETRRGPDPEYTARCQAEVRAFFAGIGPSATFLTGNHDPDFSTRHDCELAGGQIWVTHGDIVFDDLVPWGRDAPVIRKRIRAALSAAAPVGLEERLRLWRRIAASIPQRHQSEQNGLKYFVRLAIDLIWPPWRFPHMLAAWRSQPRKTADLAQLYRPRARFAIVGHTHRPGAWETAAGVVVINTGSFCRPLGALLVDVTPGRLTLRQVRTHRGDFHPGPVIREFALARDGNLPQAPPK